MAPTTHTSVTLLHGDTVSLLQAGSLRNAEGKLIKADAAITDPPYNVSLDGDREWDDFGGSKWLDSDREFMKWTSSWARPLLTDILWPGSLIAAFSAHRTVHALMFGIQDAGFDIIDVAIWLYATGQVKHKLKLRPAYEPITIARRCSPQGDSVAGINKLFKEKGRGLIHTQELKAEEGRHPLNIIQAEPNLLDLDDEEICDLMKFLYVPKPSVKDRDYGCDDLPLRLKEGGLSGCEILCTACRHVMNAMSRDKCDKCGATTGLEKKASISGASGLARNFHPTVKPINLMRRLVRLLTKPGATVIDTFMGSGTTGIACVLEGRNFVGIEREKDFHTISSIRIAHALREVGNETEANRIAPPELVASLQEAA